MIIQNNDKIEFVILSHVCSIEKHMKVEGVSHVQPFRLTFKMTSGDYVHFHFENEKQLNRKLKDTLVKITESYKEQQ